jgi:hypothetical protein
MGRPPPCGGASYDAEPMAYSLTPSGPHAGLRGMVNAADAAVGAAAVMAVTSPHLCGMGGNLLGA